jgi:tetratricopeptide (TPR) repeat protein
MNKSQITNYELRITNHALQITALICLMLNLAIPAESAFLDKPGVRPLGMGGAFVARADDSSAGLWNPAGLAQLGQTEFVANYSTLYTGLGDDNLGRTYLGYAWPLHRSDGLSSALGLNFTRLQSPLYSETTVSLALSQRLQILHLGANVKGLFANFSENEYTLIDPLFQDYGRLTKSVSFDLGMLLKVTDGFVLGIAVQNLNQPNIALDEEGAENLLPREIRGGLSFQLGRVYPNIDFTWRDVKIRDKQDINLHLGVEAWVTDDVAFRTGANLYELTAGASYRFNNPNGTFQLDYAFNYPLPFETGILDRAQAPLTGTTGSHQFALAVRFANFGQLFGAKPYETETSVQPSRSTPPQPEVPGVSEDAPPDDLDAAISNYEQAVKDTSKDTEAHLRLAQLYAKQKRYDDAIGQLKRAVNLAPNNPKYHYELGLVYEQYGDETGRKTWYNKALLEFEKTRMLDKNHGNVAAKVRAMSQK